MSAPVALDLETPVREGFTTFMTFIPKLIGFLVILLVGYLIAKLIAKAVDAVLERVGFDGAVERGGVKKAMAKSKYDASDIVAKLVFFAVFIPFLSAAVGALGIQALQEPLAAFIALIPRIIVAIVLVVVGALIAGTVKSFITNALGGLSYGSILANAAAVLILFGFVKSALDQVGIATAVTGALLYATLAAVAGVVIVGVGGGLIRPMQHRWEDMLVKASSEKDKIAAQAGSSAPTASYDATEAYPVDPTVRSTGSTTVAPASGSQATSRPRMPRP
jgi:hypothetical protein